MSNPTPPPPALAVRAVSRSDVGMRRATNQDAVVISPHVAGPITGEVFLMVADGMGAHAAGELASKMAVDCVPHAYQKAVGESVPEALREAIREANDKIHQKGASGPEFQGMGTTCSCLVIAQGAAMVGHVGDSRVYRLRKGMLEQLTFDHSLVWEMAAASKVSEDKVPACIPKNVITRSLGPHETVMIDLEGPHELRVGDVFLLCSDGLSGVVDDPLAAGVLSVLEPDHAAETLINLANLRGGPDNISVVIARVEAAEEAAKAGDGACGRPEIAILEWGVAAACLAACVWSFLAGHHFMMLAAAIGFGAAVALAVGRSPLNQAGAQPPKLFGGTHGNGPYRRIECGDHASAAGDFRDLVRELSALQTEEDTVRSDGSSVMNGHARLLVDWTPHREAHQAADAAYDRGDYADAIARYSALVAEALRAVRNDDRTHRYRSGAEVLS